MAQVNVSFYAVRDACGNVVSVAVDDPSDTVQVWGVDLIGERKDFESEAYHMSSWAKDCGFEFAREDRVIDVDFNFS